MDKNLTIDQKMRRANIALTMLVTQGDITRLDGVEYQPAIEIVSFNVNGSTEFRISASVGSATATSLDGALDAFLELLRKGPVARSGRCDPRSSCACRRDGIAIRCTRSSATRRRSSEAVTAGWRP